MKKSGFFNRPLRENLTVVANLSPANFDALKKVIRIEQEIVGKPNFSISDSKYARIFDYGKSFLSMDLKKILGSGICFSFVGDMKLLRKIRGNENVLIIRNGSEYLITNGLYEVTLGHSELNCDRIVPEINDFEPVGTKLVLNDEIGILRTFISSSKYVDLLIHGGQLDQIRLSNRKQYSFDSSVIGENRNMRPELILRAYRFLAAPGKKAVIKVVRKDGLYLLITTTSVSEELEILLYETVEKTDSAYI